MNPIRLFLILTVVMLFAVSCNVEFSAKVDSHPSQQPIQGVIHGTTDDACAYTIAPDGTITVQSGSCPIVHDGKVLLFHGANGCSYAITQNSKTLIEGTCK